MAVALASRSFLHAFEEVVHAHVPIDLVGVGNEEAGQGLFRVSHLLPEGTIVHGNGYFGGIYHELLAHAACKLVEGAYVADGQVGRFLIAPVQAAEDVVCVFSPADGVASGMYVRRIVLPARHPEESGETPWMSFFFHLIIYRVRRVVPVNVDVCCFGRIKLRIE